jgi:hypothetical protein
MQIAANTPPDPATPKPKPPAPTKEWKHEDEFLDEALDESFPASDPIAPGHVPPSKEKPPKD